MSTALTYIVLAVNVLLVLGMVSLFVVMFYNRGKIEIIMCGLGLKESNGAPTQQQAAPGVQMHPNTQPPPQQRQQAAPYKIPNDWKNSASF